MPLVTNATDSGTAVKESVTERDVRSSRLRPLIAKAVKGSSLRDVARGVGVSHNALHKFIGGATPHDRTLDKIEDWALRTGVASEEPSPTPPAPNYAGLGIDLYGLDGLAPAARGAFDRFMADLILAGADRAALERAGRTVLAPIVDGAIDEEAAQLAALEALVPVARRLAEGPATSAGEEEEARRMVAEADTVHADDEERRRASGDR